MADQKIELNKCINAREYCDKVMFRYITLLDNGTFMPSEHIQKEKEYGITWRTAFKKELNSLVGVISQKLISADGHIQEDPFEVLHKIVKKDCIDAATFDVRTQADLLSMLIDNLDMLERVIYQIKAMLKEPHCENFVTLKLQIVERLV